MKKDTLPSIILPMKVDAEDYLRLENIDLKIKMVQIEMSRLQESRSIIVETVKQKYSIGDNDQINPDLTITRK